MSTATDPFFASPNAWCNLATDALVALDAALIADRNTAQTALVAAQSAREGALIFGQDGNLPMFRQQIEEAQDDIDRACLRRKLLTPQFAALPAGTYREAI